MTALSGSEKATVSVGYLSQFFGMPVILPSMLWKGAGAGSPTRSHLARAVDLHVFTWSLAFGLVIASSAFADSDPFKAALITTFAGSCLLDVALVVAALRGIKPRWMWDPVLLRRWTSN